MLRAGFRAASRAAVEKLAADLAADGLGDIAVVVGYVDDDGRCPATRSRFVHRGEIVARYYKHHLPNYGVFDERRYFVPGNRFVVVRHRGVDIALTICEDLWQDGGPFTVAGAGRRRAWSSTSTARPTSATRTTCGCRCCAAGPPRRRRRSCTSTPSAGRTSSSSTATRWWSPQTGDVLLRAPQYVEGLYLIDVEVAAAPTDGRHPEYVGMTVERCDVGRPAPGARTPSRCPRSCAEPLPDEAEVWGALVTGLRDYVHKNGFALGRARACPAASTRPSSPRIAADAIGGDRVYGVSMPSSYSSEHSSSDAERAGASASARTTASCRSRRWSTGSSSALSLTGLAEENVQARVRGTTLMALSNAEGHLVLATGNKSELAVGYSTIYGDAVGGFAPIKDVPKSLVWALARWRNADAAERGRDAAHPGELHQQAAVGRAAPGSARHRLAARLRAARRDPAALRRPRPGRRRDRGRRIRRRPGGPDRRMVDRAEWKRRQYPPGSKISYKNFGRTGGCPSRTAGVSRSTDSAAAWPQVTGQLQSMRDRCLDRWDKRRSVGNHCCVHVTARGPDCRPRGEIARQHHDRHVPLRRGQQPADHHP